MKDRETLQTIIKNVYKQDKPVKDDFFKDMKNYQLNGHRKDKIETKTEQK